MFGLRLTNVLRRAIIPCFARTFGTPATCRHRGHLTLCGSRDTRAALAQLARPFRAVLAPSDRSPHLTVARTSLPTVGVVTVVRPELDATLRAFGMTDANRFPGGGRLHFVGEYRTEHSGLVRLVISAIGQAGNDTAASLATKLITQFKPQFMFLCGIAAGVRGRNKIGDVVVSRSC